MLKHLPLARLAARPGGAGGQPVLADAMAASALMVPALIPPAGVDGYGRTVPANPSRCVAAVEDSYFAAGALPARHVCHQTKFRSPADTGPPPSERDPHVPGSHEPGAVPR